MTEVNNESDWRESFDSLDDFCSNLDKPSNASGALGRMASSTIRELRGKLNQISEIACDEEIEDIGGALADIAMIV